MFKALCRTRLQALLSSYLRSGRRGKQRGKAAMAGFGLLMLYCFGCFLFLFYMMFSQLAGPLVQSGLGWMYFAVLALMATALGVVGSIFLAQSQLFEAKDNELLLSMPIPPSYILGSRMITLYAQNLLFEALVLLPGLVAYSQVASFNVVSVVMFVLTLLTLPVLATTLSCVLGWVVAMISARMRNKSLITMVLSLALMGAYFYFYSQLNRYLQLLLANGEQVAAAMQKTMFPLYQLGLSLTGKPLGFVWYLLCVAAPFVLVYWLLSHSFIRIATMRRGAAKIRYREKTLGVSSVGKALLQKELRHLWATPMYLLNGALGSAFLVIGAVALILKRDAILGFADIIPGFNMLLPALACLAIAAVASMNLLSAPSVSLEGKCLWIVQSMPVRGWAALKAKLLMHLLVTCPAAALCSVGAVIALPMDVLHLVLVLVAPQLFVVLCAMLGLVFNLLLPRLDWISEAHCVKQSMSVMLAMFGAWGILVALWGGYALGGKALGTGVYVTICAAVIAAACLLLLRWLKTKGQRIFENLHGNS